MDFWKIFYGLLMDFRQIFHNMLISFCPCFFAFSVLFSSLHGNTCIYIYIYNYIYICVCVNIWEQSCQTFVGVKRLLMDLVVFRIWCGFAQIVLLDLESMFDRFWIYVSIISWMDFWSWTASQASSRRQHHKLDVLFLSKYFRFTFNYQDASAVAETRLRRALDKIKKSIKNL